MDSLEARRDDLPLQTDKVNLLFNGIDTLSGILSKTQESKWSEQFKLHCQCLLQLPPCLLVCRKSWIFSGPNLKDTFNRPGLKMEAKQ